MRPDCARWRKAGAPLSRHCAGTGTRLSPPIACTALRQCSPARRAPAVQKGGQGAALGFLAGDLSTRST
ncbi:hypothetical protein FMM49_01125 (plasmid) [Streptomyces rimosus subsp. rimosus]|nr:hypothetical protein CTZ40_42140 [Streptomyces rimosus]QTL84579.1 hypothetical protein FMM49_01125 [Streptomyces rimosus subsp. rimosus]